MAVDTSIATMVRAPQVRSPLESMQRAISIADMVAGANERQQMAKRRAEEEPVRQAELRARASDLQDEEALKSTFRQTAKYNPDLGDIEYDQEAASKILSGMNRADLLPRYQSEMNNARAAQRVQAQQEAQAWLAQTKATGDIAENFLLLGEEQRGEQWINYRRSLVQMDPSASATLPQKYDASYAPKIKAFVEQRESVRSMAEKLAASTAKEKADLETRKARAEVEKLEREAKAPKTEDYPPGTLIITRDKDGKEVSRETVPFKPEDKSDKQREAELVEEAYGEIVLKGKKRSEMTAAQRVAAIHWNEARSKNADPSKKTDLDKMMDLLRSGKPEDRKMFDLLKGNVDTGPTVANKITMMNQAISLATTENPITNEKAVDKERYEQARRMYLPLWADMPTFDKAKPATTGMGDVKQAERSAPPRTAPTATPATKATTRMRAPDGTEQDIPSEMVEHYKLLGATVVK